MTRVTLGGPLSSYIQHANRAVQSVFEPVRAMLRVPHYQNLCLLTLHICPQPKHRTVTLYLRGNGRFFTSDL